MKIRRLTGVLSGRKKNKTKHRINFVEDPIITTLSIDDCLSKIAATQHDNFDVNIRDRLQFSARVEFYEDRHTDSELHVTSRLSTVGDTTRVTFEVDKSLLEWRLEQKNPKSYTPVVVVLGIILPLVSIMVTNLLMQVAQLVNGICLFYIVVGIGWLFLRQLKPDKQTFATDPKYRTLSLQASRLWAELNDVLNDGNRQVMNHDDARKSQK